MPIIVIEMLVSSKFGRSAIEVDRTWNLAAISKGISTLSLVCKKCRSLQEGPTPITKIKI
jgi:hypothetical protein